MDNTFYTPDPICPWCGDVLDSGIFDESDKKNGIVVCPWCGKKVFVEKNVEITYSTFKVEEENEHSQR